MEIPNESAPELMQDLMVLYLAEEASPTTRAVLESYAKQHKEFATLIRGDALAPPAVPGEETPPCSYWCGHASTQKCRRFLFGVGFLCLLPFTVMIRHSKIVLFMWSDSPELAITSLAPELATGGGRQVRKIRL